MMSRLTRATLAAACLLPGLASAATPAGRSPETVVAGPSVLPMILALVFVIALIPAAVWLIKRLGAGHAGHRGSLRLVESLALGPRERLVVVDDGREFILLGVTAQSISRVGTLPRRDAAPLAPQAAGFAELLRRARTGHEA